MFSDSRDFSEFSDFSPNPKPRGDDYIHAALRIAAFLQQTPGANDLRLLGDSSLGMGIRIWALSFCARSTLLVSLQGVDDASASFESA